MPKVSEVYFNFLLYLIHLSTGSSGQGSEPLLLAKFKSREGAWFRRELCVVRTIYLNL